MAAPAEPDTLALLFGIVLKGEFPPTSRMESLRCWGLRHLEKVTSQRCRLQMSTPAPRPQTLRDLKPSALSREAGFSGHVSRSRRPSPCTSATLRRSARGTLAGAGQKGCRESRDKGHSLGSGRRLRAPELLGEFGEGGGGVRLWRGRDTCGCPEGF